MLVKRTLLPLFPTFSRDCSLCAMLDFGKIVYLDVQKTGSSFAGRFFKNMLLAPPIKHVKHGAIEGHILPDATYIISVRNPLSQYISLYRYGLDQRGQLYDNLQCSGFGHLYENPSMAGFEAWLSFFLNPRSAKHYDPQYQDCRPRLYGYQTYRFLRLSFLNPRKVMSRHYTRKRLQLQYNSQRIHTHVLRTESLNQDLLAFSRSALAPHFKPAEEVAAYLAEAKWVNRSKAGDELEPSCLSPALHKRLQKREWFIYQNFYGGEGGHA